MTAAFGAQSEAAPDGSAVDERPADERLLITLDVDGTLLDENESISPSVRAQVDRVAALGHVVTLATGRSWSTAKWVLEEFGLTPRFVVCSNGALIMERDTESGEYVRAFVETFDPSEALMMIRPFLPSGSFMVEDADGFRRYTEGMSDWDPTNAAEVDFDELLTRPASRVVVVSPSHSEEEFLEIVENMGLHQVSYSIGWTAWLDIAPDGVNKATAAERVRSLLDIAHDNVVAAGDGRNDLELLEWAVSGGGRGIAMGQAPDEVKQVANEVTGSVAENGLASALASIS